MEALISDRAKALIAALHEPFTNEARWEIAQRFLDEEREAFYFDLLFAGNIAAQPTPVPDATGDEGL